MNIIGTKNPGNYFHLRYNPQAVGELCSFVHIMLVTCVHVCIPIQYLPIQIHHLVPLLQYRMSLHLLLNTVNKVCQCIKDVIPQKLESTADSDSSEAMELF